MTTGVVKTQGTRLYFAAAASDILKVACPTGANGLGGAANQIDTTCLDSEEMEKARGLLDPGQITVPINFIPSSASHQALQDLRASGETVSWMVVLSDQSAEPVNTDSNDRIVSPGPTTAEFLAYVADFSIDIATNEIVRATLTLQRSGPINWDFPSATQD
jgi:hypothetical protein